MFELEVLVTLVFAVADGEVSKSSAVAAAGSIILPIKIVPVVAAAGSLYTSAVAAPVPLRLPILSISAVAALLLLRLPIRSERL